MIDPHLLESVRQLVVQYGAEYGCVSETVRTRLDGDGVSWLHAWLNFGGEDSVGEIGDSKEQVLKKLRASLARRRRDPVRANRVMADEIDEDPES